MAARAAGLHLVIFWRPAPMEAIKRNLAEGVTLAIVPTEGCPLSVLNTGEGDEQVEPNPGRARSERRGQSFSYVGHPRNVAENSIANFFIVKRGVLWTLLPRTSSKGLLEVSYSSCRRDWGYLLKSDISVFMTCSIRGILHHLQCNLCYPRSRSERDPTLSPVPGPVTKRLMRPLQKRQVLLYSRRRLKI